MKRLTLNAVFCESCCIRVGGFDEVNISEVSKRTGLSAKSIRFYEDKGLISMPSRAENGYRTYRDDHINELMLIMRSRKVGFTLEECKELLSLARNVSRESSDVKRRAETKLFEIRDKIAELKKMEAQLEEWVAQCPGNSSPCCPIINGLKGGDD